MTDIDYGPRAALIVVDVQNDFAHPRGSLYVPGGDEVVAFVNAEGAAARATGATVIYTQDFHPPRTAHFASDGGIWPVHCVRDTWGAEFVDGLERAETHEIVRKGAGGEDGYSAFSVRDPLTGLVDETHLGELLERRRVLRVVVAGLATDYCVKATAIDACELGFETAVLSAGCRAVNLQPGDGAEAIAAMRAAGITIV